MEEIIFQYATFHVSQIFNDDEQIFLSKCKFPISSQTVTKNILDFK